MKSAIILVAVVVLPASAFAQGAPAPANQPGIGPTGSMYNGNNLVRNPMAPRPDPNPPLPSVDGGATSTSGQQSRDEGGTGAGGGEH